MMRMVVLFLVSFVEASDLAPMVTTKKRWELSPTRASSSRACASAAWGWAGTSPILFSFASLFYFYFIFFVRPLLKVVFPFQKSEKNGEALSAEGTRQANRVQHESRLLSSRFSFSLTCQVLYFMIFFSIMNRAWLFTYRRLLPLLLSLSPTTPRLAPVLL